MARIKPEQRVAELLQIEQELHRQGFAMVAGVDEAGRGPLAGPVAAAAAIMPADHPILLVNDSKKLSEKRRDEAFDLIIESAIAYQVVMISPEEIDRINILQATRKAMLQAIAGLSVVPDHVISDAMALKLPMPITPMVKADAQVYCVAAASILAKVTRDRFMVAVDSLYPEYGFAKHKAYGTAQHVEALRKYGPCPQHRRSFIGKILSGTCYEGC